MVLVAARGTLGQQLAASAPAAAKPHQLLPGRQFREEPSAPLPFMELKYFNGLGGFNEDGKEFVIYLGPSRHTPLPWINVMANPKFGALISESGAECVWGRNSQNERLTPWFNDPISDPPGTAIYIRDDDIGVVWSPTPQPIREKDAYRARHGQGYTTFEHNSHAIEQQLLTFVPVDDAGGLPVRLQRLRLGNGSSRRRKLTVTSHATLVLGSDPEETGMHVVTKWDLQSQSLFSRNSYNPEFCECITFATSTPTPASFTGDRAAFIGRNRSLRDPAAMQHVRLTGDIGAGLDPCAALQVVVEIDPGETAEMTFLLGQADDEEKARVSADRFRDPANATILDQPVPFLEAKPLEAQQIESLSIPIASHPEGTLLEHCRRAVAHSATAGPHGLPLIGGGDWNDGLNRVGLGGKGESVWLAWFEICVLNDFAELLTLREFHEEAKACRARAAQLAKTIDAQAWDGAWYRRAYFDEGTPLGSKENAEARIDSLPQTWAAISRSGDSGRVEIALRSLAENLVRGAADLILLFTPPFDKTTADVGYIKAYPPGVRENGGQYTHAATWVAMAFARQGDGDKAVRLLRMLNPVEHARDEKDCEHYKVEPYVIPGDVYSLAANVGPGRWTCFSGPAAWPSRL